MLEPTGAANMTVLALNHLLPPPPTPSANNGGPQPQQQQQQQQQQRAASGADGNGADDLQQNGKTSRMMTVAAAATNMSTAMMMGGGPPTGVGHHHHHHHHHNNHHSSQLHNNNNNNNDDTASSPRSSVVAAARPSGHIKFSVAALLADTRPVRSPTPGSLFDDDMDTPDDDEDDRNSVDVETPDGAVAVGRRCSSSTPDRGRSPMPLHPSSPPLSHHQHHGGHPFQQPAAPWRPAPRS
ncbi:unnamed protein product [Macrosiphum euphorbiae]|uniref:Uncharacterized protein n=1 Tax=Macrosiphum euphorbiae TaxID=13131 RepID=A0AAV0XJK5_9HEMI|nr:unnamed protein product [Macrosiphum euphorbiae]